MALEFSSQICFVYVTRLQEADLPIGSEGDLASLISQNMARWEFPHFPEDGLWRRDNRRGYYIHNGFWIDSTLHRERAGQNPFHTGRKDELFLIMGIKERMNTESIYRQMKSLFSSIPQGESKLPSELM
jgi:hypothetical protein